MSLTGRQRYRSNKRGEIILQLEETVLHVDSNGGVVDAEEILVWRDARIQDLTEQPIPHWTQR